MREFYSLAVCPSLDHDSIPSFSPFVNGFTRRTFLSPNHSPNLIISSLPHDISFLTIENYHCERSVFKNVQKKSKALSTLNQGQTIELHETVEVAHFIHVLGRVVQISLKHGLRSFLTDLLGLVPLIETAW